MSEEDLQQLREGNLAALIVAGAALEGRGSEQAWENLERVLRKQHGDLWTGRARRAFAEFERESPTRDD